MLLLGRGGRRGLGGVRRLRAVLAALDREAVPAVRLVRPLLAVLLAEVGDGLLLRLLREDLLDGLRRLLQGLLGALVDLGTRMWEEVDIRDSIITPDMSFMLFTDPGECVNCADYNSDNIVNFIDYADFSEDWNWTGPPGGYNNADLNCDGSVDFYDLDIFTLQWLSSCP